MPITGEIAVAARNLAWSAYSLFRQPRPLSCERPTQTLRFAIEILDDLPGAIGKALMGV